MHRYSLTPHRTGFTLIEMMASTAILAIMVALMTPVFDTAVRSITNSEEQLDIDVMARQAMDRIGRDLAQLSMQENLDYFLNKQPGNDEFDFFSYVPGTLNSSATGTSPSGITLVSYRVNAGNLERLAVAQSFDDLTFLAYDNSNNIIDDTGIARARANTTIDDYQILCEGVFRFELGFLLKDGTYDELPMFQNIVTSSEPGWREWNNDTTPSPRNFAEIQYSDATGSLSFQPLGWQDVSAIVISLAVIDPVSARRISASGINTAISNLPDAATDDTLPELDLPAKTWQNILDTAGSLGITQSAQNSIRVYQRAYYINSSSSDL